MSKERLFDNVNQVHVFLREQGFRVAYNTLHKHATKEPRKLSRPYGTDGRWTEAQVLDYAGKYLARENGDEPGAGGTQADKVASDAKLRALQAEKLQFTLDKDRGLYVLAVDVERELGARAKAFRLGLESFGIEQAEAVAGVFGGTAEVARDLCAVLGVSESKAPAVMDFMLERGASFRELWQGAVERFLDAYATGTWWTDEMREAWERRESAGGGND